MSGQLKEHNFSETQVQELKQHRRFVVICDGYDESQLSTNLHTTNLFNRPGQWKVKMVITCRTQYLGPDYRNRFVPQRDDHYDHPASDLFEEAVIAPFSKEQIESYVEQYVPLEPRTWHTKDYMDRLTTIPNLLDLVRNPFLLSLALEALPGITHGKQELSAIKITRAQLYDTFVDHWLGVNQRRLERNNALSKDNRDTLEHLVNDNFILSGINYLKELAGAIFKEQNGNPVVQYVHRQDKNSWKADFFGSKPVAKLLCDSSPLTRTGNQYRFVHRSMLEYFFSCIIYNATKIDNKFHPQDDNGLPASLLFSVDGPLYQRNLLAEPSIIQFLCDRVKLDPDFAHQLRLAINQSKTDPSAAVAATNAITILVRAGLSFHGADLRGVKIPGADLSGGQFDYAQFQGADLTGVNLSRSWLRKVDLSGAQMGGVQFGELPYLKLYMSVHACAYSPDGRMLAVGQAYYGVGGVIAYDTSSWTITRYSARQDAVRTMAFSPNGTRFVFAGDDALVRLWDCASDQGMFVIGGLSDHVRSVTFSPCGKHIASPGNDKTVRVWDSQTGESLFVLRGHMEEVRSVKYSPSGEWLVSGGCDGTIRFWNSETGEPGVVLNCSLDEVHCLAFSPDGRWIASGHAEGRSQLWHVVSGEPGPVLHGHTRSVTGIAFSPDSRWIASSSMDDTVRLWDASTGTPVDTLSSHKTPVNDVVFSPDGLQIASGGWDNKVRLWDVISILTSSVEQQDQQEVIHKTVYSPNGQNILTVSNSRTVKQWSSLTGAFRPLLIGLPKSPSVLSVSYSLDDIPTAAFDRDGTLRLWELQEGRRETILEASSTGKCVTMSPCCRWIVSADLDNTVKLWNLDSTQQMHVLIENGELTHDQISCLVFSATGDLLAVGAWDGTIWLFDTQSKSLVTYSSIYDDLEVMSFSPDGQQLAVGTFDALIYLRSLQSEERDIELRGHTKKVTCIAYSPCGEWIASGSDDKTVRVWHRWRPPGEAENWSCVSTVHCYFDSVLDIAWNPAVPMEFVTSCRDESVRVWRVSSDGEDVVVKMLWGTNLAVLHADGLVLKGDRKSVV